MFVHIENTLGYSDLDNEIVDGVRYYVTPSGKRLKSVTSVTSVKSKSSILEWRKKVGEEEANRISTRAATRGTHLHSIIEDYLNNNLVEEEHKSKVLPWFMFKSMVNVLNNISNIHLLEGALYSDVLELAGRVDCIAEYNGELAIIDFKTSTKEKKREWIEHYFAQTCAYAMMYYERTGIKVKKLVVLISCEDGTTQVFEEYDIMKYMKVFLGYLQEWNKTQNEQKQKT
jgi:ATP-dependent exoDNAse (exonuclease V) beta subunit